MIMWDLWWTKRRWGRFSLSTSVSLANSHSTYCFTLIIIWGWYRGRNTKSHPNPEKRTKEMNKIRKSKMKEPG
jgi:hypothetical protein